jgi:predicted outer membrane protein
MKIKDVLHHLTQFLNNTLPVDSRVKYSVKKYKKTYELLEEYDQKSDTNPEKLAKAGRLRPYIQELQKKSRNSRRANSAH